MKPFFNAGSFYKFGSDAEEIAEVANRCLELFGYSCEVDFLESKPTQITVFQPGVYVVNSVEKTLSRSELLEEIYALRNKRKTNEVL